MHERGGDGQTPLHFARSRRVVDLLLDAGADPNAVDVDHRSTPAQWMIGDVEGPEESRLDLAKYLVERGASADLFLAAALGLTSRARAMLEADPSLLTLRTSQGEYGEKPPSSYHIYQWTIGPSMTPLQTAAKFKERETLEAMRAFASVEQRLLLACHEGNRDEANAIVRANPSIVAGLIGAGRTELAKTIFGLDTALIVALVGGYGIFWDSLSRLFRGKLGGDLAVTIAVFRYHRPNAASWSTAV